MPTLHFVCLANSRKIQARCVAGKIVETGAWVRPVGPDATGEVSEADRRYENGNEPALLDLLQVETLHPVVRQDYQTENHLINAEYYWLYRGVVPVAALQALLDPVGPLWTNGSQSYHGKNNRVPPEQCANFKHSLRLISVPAISLSVFAPSAAFGNPRRKVFGAFHYGGVDYRLGVTDSWIEAAYLELGDGTYPLPGRHYLTVSLGEPNPEDGYAYKLIAGVIRAQ